MQVDRHWLITSTSYGTWLPGDERGFVSPVDEGIGPQVRHNQVGTLYDADMPGLSRSSRASLKCQPIHFVLAQAEVLIAQFQETAAHRKWELCAVAIMATHIHIVVGVPGDPDPEDILRDFKAYGSRALNRRWSKPRSDTWWTESGSRRKLPNEAALLAAVEYVRNQEYPLLIWIHPRFTPGERGASAP